MSEDSSTPGRASTGVADPMPAGLAPRTTAVRQCHALSYLSRFEYPVELETLAAGVAADERNVPVEIVSEHARRGVAVALHHVHLPKLVADGLVRYDAESRMAVATAATSPTWSGNA